MFFITTQYLIPKGYRGLAVFPFVFLRFSVDKENLVFINHERIHLRQQLEMLLIPFFGWYIIEFFVRFIQYRSIDLAYRNISFEREAYANEKELNYLKERSFCRFLKWV